MVLNRAASFIYNFFSPLLGQTSFKAAPCCYEVIESEGGKIVEEEVCCVCLSRLVEGEDVRSLPCLHEFHKVCVDKWFDACRTTCPLCRFPVGGNKSQVVELLTEEMMLYFSSFHISGF
ncbi:unnamed protein product [Prunus armeniaca]|uniref:RING-type E3 ubiquitin transferase n=1 Tax=Prunus dulcis TaxID=3755 RepID=A0AAD4YRI2_PRUDU|nr:hypothetical protein L3X38_039485 [Prunus dulcis]